MMTSGLVKIFWNSFMRKPFSIKWIYLIEKRSFDQKYKFSNKNDMVCAWRNFKIIFSRPLFIIIFRPKILFFVTYSILTGQTKVEFVIYWVLRCFIQNTTVIQKCLSFKDGPIKGQLISSKFQSFYLNQKTNVFLSSL